MARVPRRTFLGGLTAVGLAAARVRADPPPPGGLFSRSPPDLRVLDLDVGGDARLARRFTLWIPNHLAKDERVPLVVLFHGLGETRDPEVGAYAWVERYGLGHAYARLRRPPVTRLTAPSLFPDARLAALNASLAAEPFRGVAFACPFTPNFLQMPRVEAQLDAYAAWIAEALLPRARKEAPIFADPAHTSIDGVSLGGYAGIEVFLRRPELFGAWGGVQAALNAVRLDRYLEGFSRASRAGKLGVHLVTSEGDPLREINTGFAGLLTKRGVANDFELLPGQHDGLFLQEAGSLSMLRWHDKRLR